MVRERGREYFAEIGRKGGLAVKARRGLEFFSKIGQLGGEAVLEKYGSEHFSRAARGKRSRTGPAV